MVALSVRSVLQQLMVLGANIYLARVLGPKVYGVFAILHFAVGMFAVVGSAGLAAALVQQKDAPDQRTLSTAFWFQAGLGSAVVLVIALAAPLAPLIWRDLPSDTLWLLRGLSLGFLFTLLRSIPMLLLERELRFGWVSLIELFGSLIYYGSAVLLAYSGAKVGALVTAAVVQSLALTIAAYALRPWRPSFVLEKKLLGRLLRFGVVFQGKNIIGFWNQAATPLVVGIILGNEALGLVRFAHDTAWFPLVLVGIVVRVYFPYFSRLQSDRQRFAEELEQAVVIAGIPTFFFVGLFLGTAPSLVNVVYSAKWLPSVPALYVYAVGFAFGFLFAIGSTALDALGRPGTVFRIVIAFTIVNWIASLVGMYLLKSPLGFALGYNIHVLIGGIAVMVALSRIVPEAKAIRRLASSVAAAFVVAAVGWSLGGWTNSIPTLIAWVLGALVLFGTVAVALDRRLLRTLTAYVVRAKQRRATVAA